MDKNQMEILKKYFTLIFPWALLVLVVIVASSVVINSFNRTSESIQKTETKVDKEQVVEESDEMDADSTDETSVSKDEDEDQEYIGKIRILISGLNLRDAPSTNSNVIKQLAQDSILFITSEENGWYKVTDKKETEGYVTSGSQYVELIQE